MVLVTLIEDARRLAEAQPHHGGFACPHCGMPDGCHSGFRDTHHDDCPWLSLPKIVRALELAERYGITFEEQADGLHLIRRRRRRDAL